MVAWPCVQHRTGGQQGLVGAAFHRFADRKHKIGVLVLSWLLETPFLLLCDKEHSEIGLSINQAARSHQIPSLPAP